MAASSKASVSSAPSSCSSCLVKGGFTVELEDYIANSGIDYWIYGHSHTNINARIGNTQCLSNQLGYVFSNEHQDFSHDKHQLSHYSM